MIILLGSQAARAQFPDFRPATDWDAVASVATVSQWSRAYADHIHCLLPRSPGKLHCRLRDGTRIEFELIEPGSSAAMLAGQAEGFQPCAFPGGTARAASPTLLWLTKRSHAIWPIHWQKTITDLHWLRSRAAPPNRSDQAYYDQRFAEHCARFKTRSRKLGMSNDAFFALSAKAVGRVIEHDHLHLAVAYGERPLFEAFKPDLSQATLSRVRFEAAPHRDQLRLVREEAMVIALERFIIPLLPIRTDAAHGYAKALERICTTLTSGWFRDFAIDHWPSLCEPDKDFVTPVLEAWPEIAGNRHPHL